MIFWETEDSEMETSVKREMKDEGLNNCFKRAQGMPFPMGVSTMENGVNFSISVPERTECNLLIYKKGQVRPCDRILDCEGTRYGNLWTVQLLDFPWQEYEYNYRFNGVITADPYGKGVCKYQRNETDKLQEKKEIVLCQQDAIYEIRNRFAFETYDWKDDQRPCIPINQVIGYSLHVKGWTMDASADVEQKGTYLGIVERIPYLKDLGINQIMLMPAYEFQDEISFSDSKRGMIKKQNYWGYGHGFYFAPKSSYSSYGDPNKEWKDMIRACHKAGIEVIMEFSFASETSPSLVSDCLRYWALEYHVDGFSLNGDHLPMDALVSDPLLWDRKIYGSFFTPWQTTHNSARLGLYEDGFSTVSRRLLRGEEDQLYSFVGLVTASDSQPAAIHSVTSHNGFTLRDLVSYEKKHNEDNDQNNQDGCDYNYSWNCGEEGPTKDQRIEDLRFRQMKNAYGMLLFSPGIPMLLGGDEALNSQKGNNNAYCQDNEVGWIQWNHPRFHEMKHFLQTLISLRKKYFAFQEFNMAPMVCADGFGFPRVSVHGNRPWLKELEITDRHVGIMHCQQGVTGEDGLCAVYVAYNLHGQPHTFTLPALPKTMEWCLILDTGEGGFYTDRIQKGKVLEDQEKLMVLERTILVVAGRRKTPADQ